MVRCYRCREDTELPHICDKPLDLENIPVDTRRPDGVYVEELGCAIAECGAKHLIVQLHQNKMTCAVCTNTRCESLYGRPVDPRDLPSATLQALMQHMRASAPSCDCGGAKARTTHSDWCSSNNGWARP